jgi:hypothetical protein
VGSKVVIASYLQAMITGVVMGLLFRFYMFRRDYRQYPSYPHGAVTHLAMGFIAAVLGALAVPALAEKEFTAVTFLALAATQFREVRAMEREMLENLDQTGLVSRGKDYIEGIARVFEARNYLVMFLALLVGGATYWGNIYYGLLFGFFIFLLLRKFISGKVIGDIATVREGKVHFDGPLLLVENITFMNLGTEAVKNTYLERAMGIIIEPLDDDARATLANRGQRMAIAHDTAALMGIYRDVDTPEFMPIVRRDLDTGRVGLVILPLERDVELLLAAVRRVPVLESAVNTPLKTSLGRKAAD